jgi:hypothetical protein
MIERLPRGQFPVNAVIGREGKRTRHFHPLPTGAPRGWGVDDTHSITAERLSRRSRLPGAPHPHDLSRSLAAAQL